MWKLILTIALKSFVRSICLLLIGFSADYAIGQASGDSPGLTQPGAIPSDPAALMLVAVKSNGLTGTGLPPWHLKVSFKILDDQSQIKDQGTYEEFWVSPSKYKQIYTSTGFSQTDYGTANGVMRTGEPKWPPYLLRQIRKAFVNPLPTAEDLAGAHYTSEKYPIMFCVRKPNPPVPPATRPSSNSTYCFASGTANLRMTMTGIDNGQLFPLFRAVRPGTVTFMGRTLPSDLQVGVNSSLKNSLVAHLETIEAINSGGSGGSIADAAFVPPSGAAPPPEAASVDPGPVSLPPAAFLGGNQPPLPDGTAISSSVSNGLLIKRVDPVYPPIAIAARVSGTVILEAHIDKEGNVTKLRVVIGQPMLQQAAMDAVKQWVY